MTPFGHLAIAVLLARGLNYSGRPFRLCLAGALVPDLIDKPLGALEVAPITHTAGHSVLVVCFLGAVVVLGSRFRPAVPLLVGWTGHVGADLVVAYPKFLVNYAWPLFEPRPPPDDPVIAYWLEYATGPLGVLEASVVVAAGVVLYTRWATSDRPGTDDRD